MRGAHLQEDPGNPPPVVAGLGGGVEVLEDAGRQLHLAGQVLLQLAHVAALELAAGILLRQAPMPALPVRLHAPSQASIIVQVKAVTAKSQWLDHEAGNRREHCLTSQRLSTLLPEARIRKSVG